MSAAARVSIVFVGASITGNRGAQSMLRASLERLSERVAQADFSLLSLYPQADHAENRDPRLRIVPFRPLSLLLIALPSAVAVGAARQARWRLPSALLPRSVAALRSADLVVDLSGISFVDGRGLGILMYNVALALMPALVGTRSIKFAQALGPFETRLNRWAARLSLPWVDRVAARGRISAAHLRELGLPAHRTLVCADAAFVMDVTQEARLAAAALLPKDADTRSWVAVSASSVVAGYCRERNVDYAALMAQFIRWLIETKGHSVVLIAHSTRPGSRSTKNNDLPICRAIQSAVGDDSRCVFPDGAHDADVLRALIGRCQWLVASRFHAMISGLAMGVPSLLIGWSHKYLEVLESFELQDFAVDYADVDLGEFCRRFEDLDARSSELSARIQLHLPAVLAASLANVEAAIELLAEGAQ